MLILGFFDCPFSSGLHVRQDNNALKDTDIVGRMQIPLLCKKVSSS